MIDVLIIVVVAAATGAVLGILYRTATSSLPVQPRRPR